MNLLSVFQIVKNNLLANKLRSTLTILGLVIGIGAIIIIFSVGSGAQSLILNEINSLGTNMVGILPGASDEKGPPASVFGITITTLTYDDAMAIAQDKNVPHVQAVAAYVNGVDTISWQNQSKSVNYMGTTANYPEVENIKIKTGRFFTQAEERGMEHFVVLGYQVAEDIFGNFDPLGEKVKIKRENFTVIGVIDKRGASFFQNNDNQVIIPLKTTQKLLLGINHVSYIRARTADASYNQEVIENIKTTLRERHHITNLSDDDFTVRDLQEAVKVLNQLTDALKFFLAAVASVSLLVGGIGIMNIMLVTVTERYREIGLRKTVGATNGRILSQFIIETLTITFISGLIGILGGAIISGLIALVANYLDYNWSFVISFFSIILGFGVATIIGLIFGIYPAVKASQLDPIEALRRE